MKALSISAASVILLALLASLSYGQGDWGPSAPLPHQAPYEPGKRTMYDLYMRLLSLPSANTLFDEICPEGRDSIYHLVDVSNGTPADAVIDCGAFHAGRGQLVKVVPSGRTKKVSFFVELMPVGDLWQASVYSAENKRVQKRYSWDSKGLQGTFEDYRPDVTYKGTFRDGKLVGVTKFESTYGNLDWDNDGNGNITYVRMYYPNGTVALKGPCSEDGYCTTKTKLESEAPVVFQVGCPASMPHRCYFSEVGGYAEGD